VGSDREPPYARVLRLAAYVREREGGCTRADIGRDVPGYEGKDDAALAKVLQRDRIVLRDHLGIELRWDDATQSYSLDGPFFTSDERSALITAAAVVAVAGLGRDIPTDELGMAVESDAARVVVAVHERVLELRAAIATRSLVRFRYRGAERIVAPYGMGMWRNRWYLVGEQREPAPDGAAIRKYRLDRIETTHDPAVEVLDGEDAYDIPDAFDLEAVLHMDPNVWGSDPPVVATVELDADQLPLFLAEFDCDVADRDDETATLLVEVRDYRSFVVRLLGFGTGATLLGPPELVELRRAWLEPQAEAV
jgi:predicted DNA-binding transcriptional regulator YafY